MKNKRSIFVILLLLFLGMLFGEVGIFFYIIAFIFVPIFKLVKNKNKSIVTVNTEITSLDEIKKCEKCNALIKEGFKFCENCGVEIIEEVKEHIGKVAVSSKDFDLIYNLPESNMVEEFILRELKKAEIENTNLIPKKAETRKIILNIIFSVLLFVYISLIFFHFPILTYIIGFIVLFILFLMTRKFNFMKYLVKEVKSRPAEKISNVVMSVKQTLKVDNSKKIAIISIVFAIVLPLIVFVKPHVMYESVEGGYAVRFYTFGLTNFKTATIPNSYKGEKVVSLRGNTFSNMFFLESVHLPDTIKEIRGQAFYNCKKLTDVNMPLSLEYLGGGAFYNAISITDIKLPDTLSYIGGEAFYNAKNLVNINLPESLEEVRGSTFENCSSLISINIPNKVTRIGGHAFYGCSSLSNVSISENSKLNEIGSSAFRMCSSLYNITLPYGIYVNERAFKESPTTINYFVNYNYNYNY